MASQQPPVVEGDMNDPRNRRRSIGGFYSVKGEEESKVKEAEVKGFPATKLQAGNQSPGPHPGSDSTNRRKSMTSGKPLNAEEQMNLDVNLRKASIDGLNSVAMTGARLNTAKSNSQSNQNPAPSPGVSRGIVNTKPRSSPKSDSQNGELREVVQSSGLVFSERGELHFVLSKPKILPIKSKIIVKQEKLAKEEEEAVAAMFNQ